MYCPPAPTGARLTREEETAAALTTTRTAVAMEQEEADGGQDRNQLRPLVEVREIALTLILCSIHVVLDYYSIVSTRSNHAIFIIVLVACWNASVL